MTKKPYSMDADPSGIRERVAVTISGAIMLGAQDESAPPEGHWLTEFWKIGRHADQWRSTVWAVARALNCLPSTYSDANGHVLRAAENLTAERDRLKDLLSEVAEQFTRDDDLPGDLLQRIDAALGRTAQPSHG